MTKVNSIKQTEFVKTRMIQRILFWAKQNQKSLDELKVVDNPDSETAQKIFGLSIVNETLKQVVNEIDKLAV